MGRGGNMHQSAKSTQTRAGPRWTCQPISSLTTPVVWRRAEPSPRFSMYLRTFTPFEAHYGYFT